MTASSTVHDSKTDPIDVLGEQRWFTSHDGTPIGYQVLGNPRGVPMLLANGLGGTHAAYRFIVRHFAPRFRFYCWDYRGLYTSGRPVGGYQALTVQDHAKDALALIEHERLTGVMAFGWSMGVSILLEMFRGKPDRFDALLLHNGVAGHLYEEMLGARAVRFGPQALAALQRLDGLVTRTVRWAVDFPSFVPVAVRLGMAHHQIDREVFVDIARDFKKLDMHLYMEIVKKLGEHDATDVLSTIRAPTLVLAGTHDRLMPLAASEKIARGIPGAHLDVIPGGSHYAACEFPELINRKLERFFQASFPGRFSPL